MRGFILVTCFVVGVFCRASCKFEAENNFAAPPGERAILSHFADSQPLAFVSTANEGGEFTPHIPDVTVVDQDGHRRRFYTDLVKDKVVAIEFIFTRCTTICPPLGATFSKLQRSFGPEMGKTVFLISVSVDPSNDTPERLREWGKQFNAGPGWTLVTGEPNELRRLQQSFGTDTTAPQEHSPIVVVGNDKKSVWKKVYGLGSASALIKTIQEVKM